MRENCGWDCLELIKRARNKKKCTKITVVPPGMGVYAGKLGILVPFGTIKGGTTAKIVHLELEMHKNHGCASCLEMLSKEKAVNPKVYSFT